MVAGGETARDRSRERARPGRLSVQRVLLVALGGAIGTAIRHAVTVGAAAWLGTGFPYGTLLVNLAGSFAIGFVQQVAADSGLVPDDLRLFVTTGLMGGLTTYSAFSYETARMLEASAWTAAVLNVALTTTLCLVLCILGIAAGRALVGPRV